MADKLLQNFSKKQLTTPGCADIINHVVRHGTNIWGISSAGSGDLADLKVKSVDVEAWSPRQKKYFEVGSCSNLGDAQARRLKIRVNGEDGKKYLAHTLNNTVVAPPRMLIAFLENNLNADGTVSIPEVLRMYMGGKEKLVPKH